MLSKLEGWLRWRDSKEVLSDEFLGSVRVKVQKFKAFLKEMFEFPCETGLQNLKFYLLEHISESSDLSGSLELLHVSDFGRVIVHSRRA